MASMTSKGQVTIPKHIRDEFGLKTGDRVEFRLEKGRVVVSFSKGTILDAVQKPGRKNVKKSEMFGRKK